MRRLCLSISLLTNAVALAACGGAVIPEFKPAVVQGQYEIIATSTASPLNVALIEVNFTPTGDKISAGKTDVLVIQGTPTANSVITLNSLGAACDNGAPGKDAVQGTFSTATQLSFILTETGTLGTGTSTGNAAVSPDGSQISTGTYSSPAQCGFAADNGTLTGISIKPFSASYAGQVSDASGTQHSVIIVLSQNASNLTVTGTDNGTTNFTLTGTVIGATFDISGSIAETPVRYIGRYLPQSDAFLIYDPTLTQIGTVSGGT